MDMVEMVMPIIRDVVIIIVTVIIWPALKATLSWWRNLMIEKWIKEVIEDGVMNAQEKYWKGPGQTRFKLAKEWVIESLNSRGITVDMKWLDGVIDATVNRLRDEYEDWYRERQ